MPLFNLSVPKELTLSLDSLIVSSQLDIKDVIFNDPATIVFWSDGTKTVVKNNDSNIPFDKTMGLSMAIAKKMFGNTGRYNEIFKKYVWDEEDALEK